MNIKDIRKLNLKLIQYGEFENVQARLALRIKRSASQVSQWYIGYRTITEDTARDLEQKCNKPAGWLDVERRELWATLPQDDGVTIHAPVNVAQIRDAGAAGSGKGWPHTALSEWQWNGLNEDERLQIEAAMLAAYAQVMRQRRERHELDADRRALLQVNGKT